ncbi:MAG TPA: tetratricopeptide repeat protein [Dehalococcoidia bacterium]|nr:tetratricopeptide repeat protein [Dehalococcoidia bacterium]
MQSRWEEAVAVNQSIIDLFPTDVDAYNRLGRAYTELGDFVRAKEAYSRALELDPKNSIAQKNYQRLCLLPDLPVRVEEKRREVAPGLFIGEMGKVGVVNLQDLAPKEVLAKMTAGNQVRLSVRGQQLVVENDEGEYLGLVEPPHGFRLAKLIEGGNRYTAAIVSVSDNNAKVIIREVYQDPSQIGRLSFPVKAVEGFQPHVKDTLLRQEAVEEEALEEAEYTELEEGELVPEGFSIFEGVASDEESLETVIDEEFVEE